MLDAEKEGRRTDGGCGLAEIKRSAPFDNGDFYQDFYQSRFDGADLLDA